MSLLPHIHSPRSLCSAEVSFCSLPLKNCNLNAQAQKTLSLCRIHLWAAHGVGAARTTALGRIILAQAGDECLQSSSELVSVFLNHREPQ